MSRPLLAKIMLGIWFIASPVFGTALSIFLYWLSIGFRKSVIDDIEPGKFVSADTFIRHTPSFDVPNILLLTIVGNLLLLAIVYYLHKPIFTKWVRVPVVLWFLFGIFVNFGIYSYITCLC